MENPITAPITATDIGFEIGKSRVIADFNCQSNIELVATLSRAKQIRNRAKTLGVSWTEICRELSISKAQANRLVRLYNEFGPAYFHLSHIVRISSANYRRIAHLVEGETIFIDGQKLALNAAHSTRIRAFVRAALAAVPIARSAQPLPEFLIQ